MPYTKLIHVTLFVITNIRNDSSMHQEIDWINNSTSINEVLHTHRNRKYIYAVIGTVSKIYCPVKKANLEYLLTSRQIGRLGRFVDK